jgi:hypothetical protein
VKRDLELIRKILLRIEEDDAVGKDDDYGIDARTFAGHIALLLEAGLIEGIEFSDSGLALDADIIWFVSGWLRLTWAGHEFIAAAHDPSAWEDAKETLRGAGKDLSSVTISVLQGLLTRILAASVGL